MIIWALSQQKTVLGTEKPAVLLTILQGWHDRLGEPKGLKHTPSCPFKILGKAELS